MGKVEDSIATMRKNLEEKTGRSFDAWVELAKRKKLAKHSEIVAWLKADHTMSHGYANSIALAAQNDASAASSDDELIAAQYSGAKATMKPIHDAIIKTVRRFGDDIEISPKKAYVSIRRNKQFALIQPSTATRVDVGINLKGFEPTGRLEASGSFNAMVSHRVKVSSVSEVDGELTSWLKKAYGAG
jgi:hypothetical protein